ncbi:hypothetical protein Cni_G10032 [Canna indica]|uniref:Uncharacterized protein n=1 Tax=Canna indica TaxID=4628 RepID=A0AAQ3K975_9LILI|nr:hypothetical protein Cni_G10032 [Canna indica]
MAHTVASHGAISDPLVRFSASVLLFSAFNLEGQYFRDHSKQMGPKQMKDAWTKLGRSCGIHQKQDMLKLSSLML